MHVQAIVATVKARSRTLGCVSVILGLLAFMDLAHAASLFWSTVYFKTNNLSTCLSLGKAAMNRHLSDVRLTSLEVTGQSPGAFAAITCVSSSKGVQAIAMVSSDTEGIGRNIRDSLRSELSRYATRY